MLMGNKTYCQQIKSMCTGWLPSQKWLKPFTVELRPLNLNLEYGFILNSFIRNIYRSYYNIISNSILLNFLPLTDSASKTCPVLKDLKCNKYLNKSFDFKPNIYTVMISTTWHSQNYNNHGFA